MLQSPSLSNLQTAIITFLGCLSFGAVAQPAADGSKSFAIPRAEPSVQIDGRIDADEWRDAMLVNDLHQAQPLEYSEPSEPTDFYWMFDEDALYVGIVAHDSDMENLSAYQLREGASLFADDRASIIINPYDNNRSGYEFQVNANGVRADALYNGQSASFDWEGIWTAAATQGEDGWSAEMRIPFNTLSFDPGNSRWRVNMIREIPRRSEANAWVSLNGDFDPTVAGTMTGISNVSQGMGLDIVPSVSSTYEKDYQLGDSESAVNPSLDINYKLTPSLNLSLTFNTDFAATEVDDRQLNLQRFNPSFPEKRSFFLTDFDIFQFGEGSSRGGAENGDPFASRRIGLSASREVVDLTGGVKISGRLGNYDIGALVIRQDEYQGVDATDLTVVRVARSLLAESRIGAIATFGDPTSNDESSTFGFDFNYFDSDFFAGRTLSGSAWVQQTDNPGLDDNNMAWHLGVALPAQTGLTGNLGVTEIQENFDPRLGFTNRTGVRWVNSEITHRTNLENHDWLREYSHEFTFEQYNYLDNNELQSRNIGGRLIGLDSHEGDRVALLIRRETQNLRPGETPFSQLGTVIPTAEYNYNRARLFIRTSEIREYSAEFRFDTGDFYTGERTDMAAEFGWRPNKHLLFEVEYGYNKFEFPDVTAEVHELELVNNISFNARWSLNNLIQYDSLSDDIGINARLRWNIEPGRDFWFVLNHNFVDADEDGRWANANSSAAVKFQYTLRY